MKMKSTPIPAEALTRCTAIFVQDDDCHWYAIHENDYELFNQMLEDSIENGEYEEFEELFGDYRTGGDPISWRNENLK